MAQIVLWIGTSVHSDSEEIVMQLTPLYDTTQQARELCWFCGCKVTAPPEGNIHRREDVPSTMRTRDHLLPRSLGGDHTVTACFRCNQRKGSMSVDEFREKAPVIFAVIDRPCFKGFYGEKREAELARNAINYKPVNTLMADRLKAALGFAEPTEASSQEQDQLS